jgi:signal transduction histidine kinase
MEFTARPFAFTGVVAYPRFGSEDERRRAKEFPQNKISRNTMATTAEYFRELSELRANIIEEAAQVLPQAFHELRKLNGAALQYAEKEIKEHGESKNLLSIKGAAELMRNNFDILEALSNMDVMRAQPIDATVNLFDLVFKLKRLYQQKAGEKEQSIAVNGVRAIVKGNQKSFPIVPAVLIENAIKYGVAGGIVRVDVEGRAGRAILTIENKTMERIDPVRCFERGVRFSEAVEGRGFGLFLAKEIVEGHQGTIQCEVEGDTVRMIVSMPLEAIVKDYVAK